MRIPILSKINEKINTVTHNLNSLGDNLVGILEEANRNISDSLFKSTENIKKTSDSIVSSANTINESLQSATEDIRGTSENITASAKVMSESVTQATEEIRETAREIANGADSIVKAVDGFTTTTTNTINRFENAIERSVERLVSTIEDFKNEIVQSGVKVNIAKSAISLMPRPPEGGIMQGITTGIRDMIIPKRKSKDKKEE
ncbi:MAG: hypothetical protein HWN65_15380 [Candidatus Helarchaeota archaeon]|nr:hypothetical protein [Candidatus Helarchaeota archaeon]